MPPNPLESAKCIFWNRNVTIDLIFLTFESAFEGSKTILNVIFTKKSRASEDFYYFGHLKMLFKVKHLRIFWHQLFPNKYLFWLGILAWARNIWDFRQLKMPQNPLEPAKCIFWNKNVTIDLNFYLWKCIWS